MKKILFWLVIAGLTCIALAVVYIWASLTPPAGPKPQHTAFTLSNVTLVTPGLDRRASQSIRVEDGTIAYTGPGEEGPAGAALGEYDGAFVLPGLMDLHTHLPPGTPLELTRYVGLVYLAHGVTTVREAGDIDGTSIPAARQTFDADQHPGPRVFTTGPFISGDPPRWVNSIVVNSKEDVRAAVAQIKADGFDGAKAYDDLPVELIHEVTAAAADAGLLVIGHVPTKVAYEEALIPDTLHFLGVPKPEHVARDHVFNRMADWEEVDDARLDEIVQVTLKHDIANTPTLVITNSILKYSDYEAARNDPGVRLMPRMYRDVVWNPVDGLAIWRGLTEEQLNRLRAARSKKLDLTKRLYDAGADLRIGTDTGQPFVVPGLSVHQEMGMFVEAGIPVEDVWAIATWKAGQALRADGLGALSDGAPADFLIFREDPTQSLEALDSLEAVVSQGRLYTRSDLEAALEKYEEHFSGLVFDKLSVTLTRRLLAQAVKRDY